ncbi:YD repeat-containing protein [Luteibacter rhizovicinus]|uniref:YD repeat-containing protein n=1 Tax=Luteibacter rhizovicinus TaxID=242606 RepID=A0A4R3YH70_9GAMM|nr:hypothetical protein [Luteibacter rhizovicinus]TCV91637.1 YD repeat-containing protein [Luteibacter rhizovicinus]
MSPTYRRARVIARVLICLLAAAMLSQGAFAQTATSSPEDEYKKLIKVDEEIQPLGENPFGESVNVYDGSLSFHVTDISIPGTGPTITIGRTFQADGDAEIRKDNAAFGDWDIDIPRLSTLTSAADTIQQGPNQIGWLVNSIARTDRCTNFREPPDLRIGRPGTEDLPPDKWWNQGYLLRIPGVPDQDILSRGPTSQQAPQMSGINFVGVSKGNWNIGCLSATANGEAGEAFLAVGPDGSKYWLNYLVYRQARAFKVARQFGFMMATRVEDRFGNWLTYSYDAGKLSSIDASDGRRVTFGYTADGKQIAQVNVVAGGATRTWTYSYVASASGSSLTHVGLPDGTAWDYAFQDLTFNVKTYTRYQHCVDPDLPDGSLVKTGTVSGPSGVQGTFEARPTRHGRSGVTEQCDIPNGQPTANAYELIPRYYNNLALTRKVITGAQLGSQQWTYSYPVANATWASQCTGGCDYTTYSDVTDPSGNATRYVFSNRFDATEGKPLRTDYYAGGVAGSPVRTEAYTYASPTQGPWPTSYGYNFSIYANGGKVMQEVPLVNRVIHQDDDNYSWQAQAFDSFARPTKVQRWSNAGPSVIEQTSFYDDLSHWVIGLPLQTDNLTTGETVSRNVYNPANATLTDRYRFGQHLMSYGFDGQGQLGTFTDNNGHTTWLQDYKRGIPQTIKYQDGTTQVLGVDDFGQIAWIRNQQGSTTSYGYDAIGRVSRIDYPAGDTVAWAPKTFSYEYVGPERGISGNHWRRTVRQGDKAQVTYFDAMLRPILSGTYRNSDGAWHVAARTDYDWQGHKTFQSSPVNGAQDLISIGAGVLTWYDVIGRPVQSLQHSELGDLVSHTAYLSGSRKQVTDPKGNVTTTAYQVFDQPSYDNVIRVDAPEGIVQTIDRDIYGNPRWIDQGGVRKYMYYDGYHRLCRTLEPESGSEVMDYDAANNLAWSASGLAITDGGADGCGRGQVSAAAKTIRGYDVMNRVTSVVYPSGTDSSSFTYDVLGNPATATSGFTSWTFGRNKLGLLTAEVLNVDGYQWSLGYGYDPNGALSTVLYPDGKIVPYSPDALGRPTQVGGYANSISYFPDGDLQSFNLGSGASYLAQKNLRYMISNFSYGAGGAIAVSEDFAYDANANVNRITDLTNGGQRTKVMGYDGLNRLTSATASNLWGTESYTYDTLNNIRTLSNSGGTNVYNYDGNNLLASVTNGAATVHSFQYDPRGNTVNKNNVALTFDQANRLTAIQGKGAYLYDAAGRRVKKQSMTNNTTTYYGYNSAGQLMWEYDPSNTTGIDYIYLGKKLVASTKTQMSKVIGDFNGITQSGGDAYLQGWACSTGRAASIDVHVYVGGPYGTGTGIGAYTANQPSEDAVAIQCHASGTAYRFAIKLTEAQRVQYGNQPLYIYGITPPAVNGDNLLLPGSAQFVVPPSILAPVAVTTVNATVAGDLASIGVIWSTSPNTTYYYVEQKVNETPWNAVYNGMATSYTLSNPPDASFVYRVQACNANGCSTPTLSAAVRVAHFPPTPGSISVPGTSSGSIPVSWPGVAYATYYVVEHTTDGNWSQVYSGGATSTTVGEGATGNYYYRVKACNGNGCSGYVQSPYVVVTIAPSAAPPINGGGISNNGAYAIGWNGVPGGVYYTLLESANGGGWTVVQQNGAGNWSTSGRGNGNYVYQVQACNAGGCGPWSGQVTVTVALIPPTPTGFYMTDTITGKRENYTLYWDASPGATRYEVLRYETGAIIYSGPNRSYLAEGGNSPYVNKYSYSVRACNDQGCSAWSGRNG